MVRPAGIAFETPERNTILVKGIDKQLVGTVAADMSALSASLSLIMARASSNR